MIRFLGAAPMSDHSINEMLSLRAAIILGAFVLVGALGWLVA